MSDKRPVNLAIYTIKFPITAIISILHRVSGFILFLLIPVFLYFWQLSLSNVDTFNLIKDSFNLIYIKIFVWLSLLALLYHMLAGLRHLLMDMHIGDSKLAGKISAYGVLLGLLIISILLGVYIW